MRVNTIIETPRGSRNKFTYMPELGLFRLGKQLPAGAVFPFDFGFVPSTLAGDGDPLDVLVLLDAPTFPGCLVYARLVGVMHARETQRSGRTVDNPRLIAVASKSGEHHDVTSIKDLAEATVDDIGHFFVSYKEAAGKRFEPGDRKGRHGRATATPVDNRTYNVMQALVSKLEAIEAYRKYSEDQGGELFADLIADEVRHAERLVEELRSCLSTR